MKNYIQPGHTITLTAPAAVTSGSGLLVGAIFGIAAHDAASGEPVETLTVGVIDINKVRARHPGLGCRRQESTGTIPTSATTKTATDNTLIGVALSAVGSGADETTGRVRLNGSF